MNYFYKNNKKLFSLLLGTLLNSSLYAITLNNEPLDSFINPGELLTFTCSIDDSIIVLDMENGNLNINYGYVSEFFPENWLSEGFKAKRSISVRCNTFDMSSNVISHKNFHIIKECIKLEPKILLSLKNCLLEAPYILITGNRMVFEECFLINPQVLCLSTDSSNSNYQTIQILFHDPSQNPTLITGNVDFLSSPMKKELYLTNVKEITVEFNPQVWNNSLSENLQTDSENIVAVNSNSPSRINTSGFAERCLQKIIHFLRNI